MKVLQLSEVLYPVIFCTWNRFREILEKSGWGSCSIEDIVFRFKMLLN
jgi:hypothetical protein